eukprot:2631621-Pyramimonas_sp.AAC.1
MGRDAIRTRTWKGTRCCMRRVHRPVKAGMVWCVTECYIPWLATGTDKYSQVLLPYSHTFKIADRSA